MKGFVFYDLIHTAFPMYIQLCLYICTAINRKTHKDEKNTDYTFNWITLSKL